MCFALNIDEQLLYSALFSHNAKKALERIFDLYNEQKYFGEKCKLIRQEKQLKCTFCVL